MHLRSVDEGYDPAEHGANRWMVAAVLQMRDLTHAQLDLRLTLPAGTAAAWCEGSSQPSHAQLADLAALVRLPVWVFYEQLDLPAPPPVTGDATAAAAEPIAAVVSLTQPTLF